MITPRNSLAGHRPALPTARVGGVGRDSTVEADEDHREPTPAARDDSQDRHGAGDPRAVMIRTECRGLWPSGMLGTGVLGGLIGPGRTGRPGHRGVRAKSVLRRWTVG